ncbi:STAS domain-containing protein [Mycobacterium sp. pV006]|uniref:STAS domain-containing protein n=1 Tax=Mycobacterium sp. pV006 TaxID=3238983 RepID=UPI00351AEE2B
MATPLDVRTGRTEDGRRTIVVVGELDLSNVAALADALAVAAADAGGAPLRIDLGRVDYLDSGAINVLFEHAASIELVVNPILLPVLTHSGLVDVVRVTPAV